MDGGERWRMIRCAGATQDKTIINQIMLKFRPIAPKPVNSGQDNSDVSSLNNKSILLSKRKTRRKYVRVRKNNRLIKRNQKISSDQEKGEKRDLDCCGFNKVVTLQLLPEKTNQSKDPPERDRSWCNLDQSENNSNNSNDNQRLKLKEPVIDQDQTTTVKRVLIVESWVTVESVTDTNQACMDGKGGLLLGCTDVERVKNLEEDTRPGFISDGLNNVRWVNGAYKKMVSVTKEENDSQSVEIMVWLLRKEKLVPFMYRSAFTCWVRLQYALENEREKEKEKYCSSQMVPCDVWRMDCGGFAWRLDVEAALSLGR